MGSYDHNTPSAFPAHLDDRDLPHGIVTVDALVDRVLALYDAAPCTRNTNPDGHRLTFAEICAREPRLVALAREIDTTPRRADFCANAVWYGRTGYKSRLAAIIGHFATQEDAALCTSDAYEVAYQALYDRLPDCDHDGSCRG
ncbi:MAG: hypothetical protein ACTHMP_05660 [Thermomicrobiales bacterium]